MSSSLKKNLKKINFLLENLNIYKSNTCYNIGNIMFMFLNMVLQVNRFILNINTE